MSVQKYFLLSRCCIGYLMRNDASPNLCTAITVRHISANIKFKSTYICCAHVVQTHSKNLCGTKKQYDLLFLRLFLLKLSVIKVEVYIQSSFLQIPFVFLLWQQRRAQRMEIIPREKMHVENKPQTTGHRQTTQSFKRLCKRGTASSVTITPWMQTN